MDRQSATKKEPFESGLHDEVSITKTSGKAKFLRFVDGFAIFCLIVLVVSLPMSAITSTRDICLGMVILLWIVRSAVTKSWRPRTTGLESAWIIYGLFVVLSLFAAVDLGYSLNEFRGEYIKGLLLFLLVVQFITTERRMKCVLFGLVGGNILMVTVGIVQFFVNDGSLIIRDGSGWSSLHEGGGTYSTYLVTVFPFLFWMSSVWKKRSTLLFTIGLAVANVFSLYISFQRGGWIAFVIMLTAAIFLFAQKSRTKWVYFAFFLAALAIGFCLAPRQIFVHEERVKSYGEVVLAIEKRIDERASIWRASLGYIVTNPFNGAGFGRHSPKKKYDFFNEYGLHWHAHNTFLDIGLELGIQGLAVFVFLWGRLLWLGFRGHRTSPAGSLSRFMAAALMLMIVGVFFRNMFDDFFVDDTALLFWFLAGLSLATSGLGLKGQCVAEKKVAAKMRVALKQENLAEDRSVGTE